MNFAVTDWFYSVFHPVTICDVTEKQAHRATCTWWKQFCNDNGKEPGDFWRSGHGWSADWTYEADSRIEWGNGTTYGFGQSWRSLQDGNIGHNPSTSPAWWEAVDDGLGADGEYWDERPDDGYWTTIPGFSTMNRMIGGLVSYHMYTSVSGVNIARVSKQFGTGHWFMGMGSPLGVMAVRMSPTEDTCYWGNAEADEYGGITATIYKTIQGVTTQIAQNYTENPAGDINRIRVYAYNNTIGIDLPTWVYSADDPINHSEYETLLEVIDNSIPYSGHEYVGARFVAPSSEVYLIHEGAAGSFDAPAWNEFTLEGLESDTTIPNISIVQAGGLLSIGGVASESAIGNIDLDLAGGSFFPENMESVTQILNIVLGRMLPIKRLTASGWQDVSIKDGMGNLISIKVLRDGQWRS